MHKFFVDSDNITDDNVIITGGDVNHIKNVLRMKKGGHILVGCGQKNEYECEITSIGDTEITAEIKDVFAAAAELPAKIYLFQGLPKSDKMELIIQKAVELGAYEIVPVSTKRSVIRLDENKASAKVKRWNMISESAAKQSKRTVIPKVNDIMNFNIALDYAKKLDLIIIPYEEAENMDFTIKVFESAGCSESIGVFIGPEGGFSADEIELAKDAGAEPITLGKRILRTETAGIAVLSILMYTLEQ